MGSLCVALAFPMSYEPVQNFISSSLHLSPSFSYTLHFALHFPPTSTHKSHHEHVFPFIFFCGNTLLKTPFHSGT